MAASDIVFIVVMVFTLAIGLFVAHYAVDVTVDGMLNQTIVSSSSGAVNTLNSTQDMTARYDYIIFAGFIAFVLALLVTGWLVGGHPIFMIGYFLVVVIMVGVSAVLSNVWDDVSSLSVFGTTVNNFPITNHILDNFPYYAAVIGIAGLLVMFAKPFIIERSEI